MVANAYKDSTLGGSRKRIRPGQFSKLDRPCLKQLNAKVLGSLQYQSNNDKTTKTGLLFIIFLKYIHIGSI